MTKEWEKPEDLRRRKPVLWLTMTALFMAMVVVLSMSALSIPVPGGHLYFNDVVIDTAAMLMDPLSAFIACGVGAFLGDLLFYPAPMFVSLITHGLQALVISLLCRKLRMKQPLACAIAVLAGAIVMVVGYTLGRAFEPDQRFGAADGSTIVFDSDFYGNHRGARVLPGPFATLDASMQPLF